MLLTTQQARGVLQIIQAAVNASGFIRSIQFGHNIEFYSLPLGGYSVRVDGVSEEYYDNFNQFAKAYNLTWM